MCAASTPNSADEEIFAYTRDQRVDGFGFPAAPPRFWLVFIKEGGAEARLWSVLENRGEIGNDGVRRQFDLLKTDLMADLRSRLVIRWNAPRSWWMRAKTAGAYPVSGIADAEPIPFPGFDAFILDHADLQAVMREPRYASWRTALGSVKGIYLITDTSSGRQYVGKADGADSIRQRWAAYAANVMAAIAICVVSCRRHSASRSCGYSIRPHRRRSSTTPRATTSEHSTPGCTG
ncbi:hypothetical protein Q9R19_06300 [Microbacterium sp. ARD32]|uniref:hypothetical protein n=1 Tax=Microbacterium sp. ARD32 TaxID=2962577 RepID=UPI002881A4B0|nr:hypothetical protein [Microbacterium sp. ARD32]MDT0157234.1 hypothetical protein [Microbacterium sp. ARD32]